MCRSERAGLLGVDALAVEARRVLAAQVDQHELPVLLADCGMAPADDPPGVHQGQVAGGRAPDQNLLLLEGERVAVSRCVEILDVELAWK